MTGGMKSLALVIATLVAAPRLAVAEDPAVARHAALLAAMSTRACVPPAKVVVDKRGGVSNQYALVLGVEDATLVACAVRRPAEPGASATPFACWTVDANSGALASRPVTMLAGRAHRVASGCAEGYCRPNEKPAPPTDDLRELLAVSVDGTRVARLSGATLQLYDRASKALRLEVPLLDDEGEGTGLGVSDIIVAGDTVFVAAYAAGPDAHVWMWNATTGTSVGPVGVRSGDDVDHVNISSGGYALTDATHLVATDGGYTEATVDAMTGKVTRRLLPRPAACSAEDWSAQQIFDIVGPDAGDAPRARCTRAVRAAQRSFWKAKVPTGMLAVGGKRYAVRHANARAELLILDAGATTPRSRSLRVCKVK